MVQPVPDYLDIQDIFKIKGYLFFDKGVFNLNIVGIRAEDSRSNRFDDFICVYYRDIDGEPRYHDFPATTDPGSYYLMNPLNKNGTLILCPGQYKSAYILGVHGRSSSAPYEALEQINSMTYVRDNNRDPKLDFSLYRDPILFKENRIDGIFKSNLHRASKWKIVQLIERYSAGCQVIQSPADFERLMNLARNQIKYRNGNKFSFTLIEEKDLL